MTSFTPTAKTKSIEDAKRKKGSEDGRKYEILSLALLTKRGYDLSNDANSEFCDFAIGRELSIGRDAKFDDVVFRYEGKDDSRNLICLQIKHKHGEYQIDSKALSVDSSKSKGGKFGNMRRDFNLQKYFISYLNIREELKVIESEEFCNRKIKYVAIFTNAGLNIEDLKCNRICLKEAPDDIIKLFNLKDSLNTEKAKECYQIHSLNENLQKELRRSSDLHRIARKLAQYVVWENEREKTIMGIDESPIKYYHVALEREVVKKSDEIKNRSSKKHSKKNEQYCEPGFREDFINNDKTGSKQELRDALFEAIRELDESKKDASDEELKGVLKNVSWKSVPNFGKTKQKCQSVSLCNWKKVTDDDIKEFLGCLVFIVNQPRVEELEVLFKRSVQDNALRKVLGKIENAGPGFKKNIKNVLEINLEAEEK